MNDDYTARLELFRMGAKDAEEWRPFRHLDCPHEDAYVEGYDYVSQGLCRHCQELLNHCEC